MDEAAVSGGGVDDEGVGRVEASRRLRLIVVESLSVVLEDDLLSLTLSLVCGRCRVRM